MSERSGRLRLVLAWAVVGLPLAWGVTEVVRRALAIFGAPP